MASLPSSKGDDETSLLPNTRLEKPIQAVAKMNQGNGHGNDAGRLLRPDRSPPGCRASSVLSVDI
uniref:Uncharacterized protein n=1 Tax=Oryza glumipatula TaxID=40148 RepID=A0A0E0BRM5_9ORYZ